MGDESKPMETEVAPTDQSNSTSQTPSNTAMDTANGGASDGVGEPNQAPSSGSGPSNEDGTTQQTVTVKKEGSEAAGNSTHGAQQPHSLLQAMSTRQYLDTTVVPILLQALQALAKERPAEPIDFIVNFLTREKNKFGPIGGGAGTATAGQQLPGGGTN